MKRLFCFLLTVLLLTAVLAGGALAAEFPTIMELYSDWEMNGYPDYVAGVCSTSGGWEMTVLLVEGADGKADEIRAMLDSTDGLTIDASAKYSHNELMAVYEEIISTMASGSGDIVSCSLGWHTVDGEVTGFGESGKESRVVVGVKADKAQEYADRFAEEYGDMVVVETSEGVVLDSAATEESAAGPSGIWIAVTVLAVCVLGSGILLARRRALATASGPVVTDDGHPSRRAVGQAIAGTQYTPRRTFEDLKARL